SDILQKVHVTVYYETLCPDSRRFVTFQLYPAWKDLKDHLILEFVPFGKSSGDGFGGFICQHGERECRGNLMQSCALSLLGPSGPQMEFVYCVMSSTDGSKEGKRCSDKVGISWAAVDSCMKSTSGTALQLLAQQETLNLAPSGLGFVPTITFNKAMQLSLNVPVNAGFPLNEASVLSEIMKERQNPVLYRDYLHEHKH
ncbi:hypothetical protein Cfor_04976, partial [Coptotermes formosanus]